MFKEVARSNETTLYHKENHNTLYTKMIFKKSVNILHTRSSKEETVVFYYF